MPAEPLRRAAAGAADLALCGAAGRALGLGGGGRLALAFVYHAASWKLAGSTLAGLALGARVVSVDGRPVSWGQALLRALAAPAAPLARRAVHDQLAGTEVVRR